MKIIKKILIITITALVAIVLVLLFLLKLQSPGVTPNFINSSDEKIENSIAEMNYIKIGGVDQFMLTRGENINNPILLILHGGPGNSTLPMFRYHNYELENKFIVAYWEQRGAGKSTELGEVENSFTIEQFVQDGYEVTQYLKPLQSGLNFLLQSFYPAIQI